MSTFVVKSTLTFHSITAKLKYIIIYGYVTTNFRNYTTYYKLSNSVHIAKCDN